MKATLTLQDDWTLTYESPSMSATIRVTDPKEIEAEIERLKALIEFSSPPATEGLAQLADFLAKLILQRLGKDGPPVSDECLARNAEFIRRQVDLWKIHRDKVSASTP